MAIILSILMLGGIGLMAGATMLLRRGDRRKSALMAAAALVAFANVALLVVPLSDGRVPAEATL